MLHNCPHRRRRWAAPAAILILLAAMALLVALAPLSPSRAIAAADTLAPLDVVINEITWMGTTASANHEWIELYNNTDAPIDLAGWTLTAADGTPNISLSGVIPSGGHYLLERTSDASVPGVAADRIYTGALGNEGEDLILRDSGGTIVDWVDCSLGWFAGHNEARVPMTRVQTTVGGSLASNWTHNPRCGSATNSAGVSHTCTLTTTYVGQPLEYAVWFNDHFTATAITTDITPMEDALLQLIGDATATIDVALYGLNRQSIVDALIQAHQRGVAVRVIGDDDAAISYGPWYQALQGAGIPVTLDTNRNFIQHNKFFLFDAQVVWTGSTNLTDTGFTLNANNSIKISDPVLASAYATEFNEMWAGYFQRNKTDNTPHMFDYNGTRLQSYFSPTDLVAFEVWDLLASAETVHFAMFFFTDDMLAERMVERLATGAEVYGVMDGLGAASSHSVDDMLCDAGALIRTERWAGKLHHKFAVLDVWGADPIVITGSYNWTFAGAYDNDENTLIIHDRTLAETYYTEWERLWLAAGIENQCSVSAEGFLDSLARDTWAYLHSDQATVNHLPFSWWSASLPGGDYANTTEIGLYALSWLAAHDLGRPWSPSWPATEAEVHAILDQLRAWQTGSQTYQPHGPNAYQNSVFYQWYWIAWTPPVVGENVNLNQLVPSVDNAWLAASLITIREYALANNHPSLAQKADAILQDMDFRLWYDDATHLFYWGDIQNPQGGGAYDYYSSESRIINFVARALSQLSRDEFLLSLDALEQSAATYDGITVEKVSWNGASFLYTSPAIFIREMDTSYGANTIAPATQAQIAYASNQGYGAWGLSDCFDVGDDGYVNQGAPPVAMPDPPETRPGLVAPYASGLALNTPLGDEALTNLQAIAAHFDCAYDPPYGFRDSVMTNPAAPDYGQCSDRFSALAQEWILLAIANYENDFIGRYFYRDPGVLQAHVEMYGGMGCGLIGDFNEDGEVTVADLIMIGEAWGLEVGDDGWQDMFDLRVDGRIDIVDVMIAAAHFGDRCP